MPDLGRDATSFPDIVMEWIYLESLVALAIAIAIVWWTVAPLRKRRKRERTGSARGED